MAIELIDKIKPKNGGKFPMVDAEDVLMGDGNRLSAFAEGVASKEYVHDYVQDFVPDVPEGAATEEYVQQYVEAAASELATGVEIIVAQKLEVFAAENLADMATKKWVEQYVAENAGGGGASATVILPETKYDGFVLADFGYTHEVQPNPFSLVVGETYRVMWDTNWFDCVAQDVTQMFGAEAAALGDLSAVGGSGNGEPFVIGVANGFVAFIAGTDPTTSHTVAIYSAAENADAPPVSIDLSKFESEGKIAETFADGTVATTFIAFDTEGRPASITDKNGNVTTLIW